MKKLRNVYNYNFRQVIAFLLLLVCIFVFQACKHTRELAVTHDTEIKEGERDGAQIDSLNIEIVKKLPNGDYLIAYSIFGQITEEYWGRSLMLKKIRLIEENNYSETDSYDKRITITPVQCYFFGKAGLYPQPFKIRNEYLIKNNLKNPAKKILFICGEKEHLLELL